MIARLARWVRSRRSERLDVRHLNLTVYSRELCSCCHKAIDLLSDYQRRYGFTLETVDVDSDPALAEKSGLPVPAVAVGGKVSFTADVKPVLFERLLRAESRKD